MSEAETAANKSLVQEFCDQVFSRGDISNIDRFMRDDYFQHNPTCADGRAGFLALGPQTKIIMVYVRFNCTLKTTMSTRTASWLSTGTSSSTMLKMYSPGTATVSSDPYPIPPPPEPGFSCCLTMVQQQENQEASASANGLSDRQHARGRYRKLVQAVIQEGGRKIPVGTQLAADPAPDASLVGGINGHADHA